MSQPSSFFEQLPYAIEPSKAMEPFWQALNEKRLMTTECKSCQTIHFPPETQICSKCYGKEIEWLEIPPRGTVQAESMVHAPPPGFPKKYRLISVRMDKIDAIIVGRFEGETIAHGDSVSLKFENVEGQNIYYFGVE